MPTTPLNSTTMLNMSIVKEAMTSIQPLGTTWMIPIVIVILSTLAITRDPKVMKRVLFPMAIGWHIALAQFQMGQNVLFLIITGIIFVSDIFTLEIISTVLTWTNTTVKGIGEAVSDRTNKIGTNIAGVSIGGATYRQRDNINKTAYKTLQLAEKNYLGYHTQINKLYHEKQKLATIDAEISNLVGLRNTEHDPEMRQQIQESINNLRQTRTKETIRIDNKIRKVQNLQEREQARINKWQLMGGTYQDLERMDIRTGTKIRSDPMSNKGSILDKLKSKHPERYQTGAKDVLDELERRKAAEAKQAAWEINRYTKPKKKLEYANVIYNEIDPAYTQPLKRAEITPETIWAELRKRKPSILRAKEPEE